MKDQWQQPELIVLMRSRPEEAVLTACKGGTIPTLSGSFKDACEGETNCGHDCSSVTTS